MEPTAQKEKATGEKEPATVLELGPMLYCGVSATQATETRSSPEIIPLMTSIGREDFL